MTPSKVLLFASGFEAALLLIAYALGWLSGVDPLAAVTLDFAAVACGLIAVLPMLLLLWWGLSHPDSAMGRATSEARQFVEQFFHGIGPAGFLLVSMLAGLGEEALFRGLIQVLVSEYAGVAFGLIVASILFGLAHAVSMAYAVAATVVGAYLGLLFLLTGSLTTVIVCHGVYDFIALLWLSRISRYNVAHE